MRKMLRSLRPGGVKRPNAIYFLSMNYEISNQLTRTESFLTSSTCVAQSDFSMLNFSTNVADFSYLIKNKGASGRETPDAGSQTPDARRHCF